MEKTASVTKLRGELSEYISALPEEKYLQVLKHNELVAVLVDPDHYNHMLAVINDIEDIKDMLVVMKDYYEGENMKDADDLFKELGL